MINRSRKIRTWTYVAAVATIIAVVAALGLIKPKAQPTSLGPVISSVATSTSALLNAIPSNPGRRGFSLCNLNQTAANFIVVTTGTVTPTTTNGLLIPASPANGSPSCYNPPSNIAGGLGTNFNAIAGAGTPVLVMIEF